MQFLLDHPGGRVHSDCFLQHAYFSSAAIMASDFTLECWHWLLVNDVIFETAVETEISSSSIK